MHIIIGMPGHIIMHGMPQFIIAAILSQHSFIISIDMPSIGVIVQTMPAGVISHVIWHIIIGIGMPIMPGIIGITFIMLAIGFIGICIAGIICGVLLWGWLAWSRLERSSTVRPAVRPL